MEFEKKVNSLIANQFIEQGIKISSETVSGNEALKYSTSGDLFVDNFASAAYFKTPRPYNEINKDMTLLWNTDPKLCVKLAIYLRLITRKSKVVKHEKLDVQRGQGLKNEGIMRMLWLAINQPKTFECNIDLFIAAGSWKDIFKMLSLDLQYHGWNDRKLNWNFIYKVILSGLNNPETTNLVRKYLPTIRTNKHCNTIESQANTLIGRWLANKMFFNSDKKATYKSYRELKSKGLAHEWQQMISKQLYDSINFDGIAGRALSILVGSKFLENHSLIDKYVKWISNKPVAKFTGYVFELFKPFDGYVCRDIEKYREDTINAQFNQLIQIGKTSNQSKLLAVVDCSGSMYSTAIGCNCTSILIAKSLALYFSEFLTGVFSNCFAEFDKECRINKFVGKTPVYKFKSKIFSAYGNTNFQSVIDLFIKLKDIGIPECDFPEGILCLSDGDFDNTGSNKETNFQLAIKRLKEAGFSDKYVNSFKIILWDIPNLYYDKRKSARFEDFADAPNFFYMSGFDPSNLSFILEGKKNPPKNAKELFLNAMNQDLLNMVKIIKRK